MIFWQPFAYPSHKALKSVSPFDRASEGNCPSAELQKVWRLPAALQKVKAMPSRRGDASRLPELLPLPAAGEGPKRWYVILLM